MTDTTASSASRRPSTLAALALLAVLLSAGAARAQWSTPNASGHINSTNTGNVGVGTPAPDQKLGVEGMLGLYPTTGVLPTRRGLFFFHAGTEGLIYAYNYPGGTGDPLGLRGSLLSFSTYVAGTSYERMTVTNGGNVGIGTSAPTNPLTIKSDVSVTPLLVTGTNPNVVGLSVANSQAGSKGWAFQVTGSGNSYGAANGSFVVRQSTDNVNAMIFSPVGDVGIGTATPVSKLHLYQSASNTRTGISIDTAGTQGSQQSELNLFTLGDGAKDVAVAGTRGWHLAARGNAYAGPAERNDLQLWAWNGTTTTITQYWDAAGNVGIGTITPGFRFDVQGGQVNASGGLCIAGDCKTSWSQVGASQWTTTDANIHYGAGNVGVGTSSPTAKLDVNGSFRSWSNGQGDVAVSHSGLVSSLKAAATIQLALGANNSEAIRITTEGKVGIGTATPTADPQYRLHVEGGVYVNGNLAAKYQDVAEWVPSSQRLAPGTVVVLDTSRSNHVLASATAYDTAVAGVVSETPGIILGEAGEGKVKVATTGRVRVKVDATKGAIRIGDLLVTSDVQGVAMKSEPIAFGGRKIHSPGTIIGKALEPLAGGVGEILVLLSMQ